MEKNTYDLLADLLRIVNKLLDTILNKQEISPEQKKIFLDGFSKYLEEEKARGKNASSEDIHYKFKYYFHNFRMIERIFSDKKYIARSYINILLDFRNQWAHKGLGPEPFSIDDVEYACKTALYLANAAKDYEANLEIENIFEALGELKNRKPEGNHLTNESDSNIHEEFYETDLYTTLGYIRQIEVLAKIDFKYRPGLLTEFFILLFEFYFNSNPNRQILVSRLGQYVKNTLQFKNLEKTYQELIEKNEEHWGEEIISAVNTLIQLPDFEQNGQSQKEFVANFSQALWDLLDFFVLDYYQGFDDYAIYDLTEGRDYCYSYEEISELICYLLEESSGELQEFFDNNEIDGFERIKALLKGELEKTDYGALFVDESFTIQDSPHNNISIKCKYPGLGILKQPFDWFPEEYSKICDPEKWPQRLLSSDLIGTNTDQYDKDDEELPDRILANQEIRHKKRIDEKAEKKVTVERGKYPNTIHFSDGVTSFAYGYRKIKLILNYLPDVISFLNGHQHNPDLFDQYIGNPVICLPSKEIKEVVFGKTKGQLIWYGIVESIKIINEDGVLTHEELSKILYMIEKTSRTG